MADRRANYGIDAPGLVRGMAFSGAAAGVVTVISGVVGHHGHGWATALQWAAGWAAVSLVGMACYMVWYSKVGKVRGRERLLELVPWSDGDAVLDVGCGRGLLLVAAARRVAHGRAVGVDLWQAADQSGNRPTATLDNARIEGVADRATVVTADVRTLPFADGTFDLVVTHWVIHNLYAAADRSRAITEMVRVLRPGGHLLLADIAHRSEYAAQLTALGLEDVRKIVPRWTDPLRAVLTFGNFQPATVVARKALA
jgi:arsenite methyltransferase